MIRILTLFVIVFLLALGGVWLADHPGSIRVEWLGTEIEASLALGLAFMALIVGIALFLNHLASIAAKSARGIARYRAARQESRSRNALANGLLALAAGDAEGARRVMRMIGDRREDRALTRFLQAQSADLLGVRGEARAAFEAMLEDPETELLALLGLSDLAKAEGDGDRARDFARRAFRLSGGNARAFRTHIMFLLEDKAWAEARSAVEHALKQKALPELRARALTAGLLSAEAWDHQERGDSAAALTFAQRALGIEPGFTPAALLAADLLQRAGKRKRAAAIIETAWALDPHPRLGEIYGALEPKETPAERWHRLQALVSPNKDHVESRLLLARQAVRAGLFQEARSLLQGLTGGQITARIAMAMAMVERADGQDPAAVEHWLMVAAQAPRDGYWACGSCAAVSNEWSLVCPCGNRLLTVAWNAAQPALLVPSPFAAMETLPAEPSLPDPSEASDEPKPRHDPPRLTPPAPGSKNEPDYVPPRPPDDPGPDAPSPARDVWS